MKAKTTTSTPSRENRVRESDRERLEARNRFSTHVKCCRPDLAVNNYRKALELNPNDRNAKENLKQLGVQSDFKAPETHPSSPSLMTI
jgi:hypothetical protein